MRRETLLLICVTSMGVMNLLPWGGPTMRAASVLGIESNELWGHIIPMQIVGLFLAVGTAIFWGFQEKKRIAKLGDAAIEEEGKYDDSDAGEKNEALLRPKNFIINVIITIAVIAVLVWDKFPSYYVFMVGCAVAIFVNYHGKKLQNSIIKSHAAAGLTMASTIMCRRIPRCSPEERHHGRDGSRNGKLHSYFTRSFLTDHHRRAQRSARTPLRYRLLLLRSPSCSHQRWCSVRC